LTWLMGQSRSAMPASGTAAVPIGPARLR